MHLTLGLKTLLVGVFAGFFIVVLSAASGGSPHRQSKGTQGQVKYTFEQVAPSDLEGLRKWARLMCSDSTVETLAAELGTQPQLSSIIDYLTKGFPSDSRRLVEEVCREELDGSP